MSKKRFKEWFLMHTVPYIFVALQRLYGLTLRVKRLNDEEAREMLKKRQPLIYAVWHCNVLFVPLFLIKTPTCAMISDSRDGELITRVVKAFGHSAVRGSSTRGGIKALKNFIKTVRSGTPGGITPDGPLGPVFKVKEGILMAAQRTGAPIIPLYYEATPQWSIEKSWDKQKIPKPFSRVVLSYGKAIYPPESMTEETTTQWAHLVEEKLLENMERCRAELKKYEAGRQKGRKAPESEQTRNAE